MSVVGKTGVVIGAGITANDPIISALIGGMFLMISTYLSNKRIRDMADKPTTDRRKSAPENHDIKGWVIALIAGAAFIISAISLSHKVDVASLRTDAIQQSRYAGALDSCYVLRHLVFVAYKKTHTRAANQVLTNVGLANCQSYATLLVYTPKRLLKH